MPTSKSVCLPYSIELTLANTFWRILFLLQESGMIKRLLSLLPSDEIVTAEPLAELIDYAIKHTQQGGDMQIQVLLMEYRHEHFP